MVRYCGLLILTLLACPPHLRAEPGPRLAEAALLFERGKFGEAKELLLAVRDETPEEPGMLFNLGKIYLVEGEYDEAVDCLEDAVHADSSSSVYHQWLGRACGRKAQHSGGFAQAVNARRTLREFEKAVALDPGNTGAALDLVNFCVEAPEFMGGGMGKARGVLETIEQAGGRDVYLARALIARKCSDNAAAEAAFGDGLKEHAEDPVLRRGFGALLTDSGQYGRAFEVFDGMLEADPADVHTLLEAGRTGALSGMRPAFSRQCLEKFISLRWPGAKPSIEEARKWLAMLDKKRKNGR